jgi:hypothetical protein
MATANANYKIVTLTGGTNGPYGEATGATVVHEVYCIANGSVTIFALGGGSMTTTLTANQSISVLCGRIVVNSGTFVGFSPNNMGINGITKRFI